MKAIVVTPKDNEFVATYDKKKSYGQTIGQAIDALGEQMEEFDTQTLYIVQRFQPDEFFTAEQQKRMSELMKKLKLAQNGEGDFSLEEKSELEILIEAELEGSGKRTKTLAELMNE